MPKKVFELAKEIGVGAIDLVEQLKSHGFDVKNHMVSLSDEDVEKAMSAIAPKNEKPAKKKVTKKKVEKKKVTKKKVVKKGDNKEEPETLDTAGEEKPVVKKKTVTRKKVIKKEAPEKYEGDRPQGLQVISRPEAKIAEASAQEKAPAPGTSEEKVYKEKMHTFTPVFVPPEEKKEEGSSTDKPKKVFTNAPATPATDSKKRMGDLAAAVAKKKTKDLTQVRADEELKLATVVTGRQIYTPMKRKKVFHGETKQTKITEVKDAKRVVEVFGGITASDLANKLSVKFTALQNKVLELNLLLKKEDYIGIILATEISALYDYRVENRAFDEDAALGKVEKEDKSHLPVRNSIITIMGHVDHGKTTLLDHLRKTKVTDAEAGGITQHIGAYSVKVDDSTLTFLDTPGHAAFGSMRQRGADVTDIVVLVVAADDGVMPQTKESIKYARKAGSPIIVAMNKMDKEGANPDRIKQELTEFELISEDWGGDTMFVPISALKGDGIDELLESIKLQAEMMDLREDPKGKAEGMIIEAKVETGRGAVATVLIQKGLSLIHI